MFTNTPSGVLRALTILVELHFLEFVFYAFAAWNRFVPQFRELGLLECPGGSEERAPVIRLLLEVSSGPRHHQKDQ